MAKPPARRGKLTPQAQFFLKFFKVAPVLSGIALVDMRRLESYISIDVIKLSKITERFKATQAAIWEVLPAATALTWVIWLHLLRISSRLNRNGLAAMYFLLLFIMEQYRFLEVQEAYIFEKEEYAMSACPMDRFIPTDKEHRLMTGHDCAICQSEPIGLGEWVYWLHCGHQFHR